MVGLVIFLVATSFSSQASAADPLLAAQSGQLHCYAPDAARKTCRALAGYRLDGEDAYVNRAEIPLAPDGSVTMTTSSRVRIVSGAVCGTLQAEDIARAEVKVSGSAMPAEQATQLLTQVAHAMDFLIGHEVCTRYERRGDGLVAEVSMDGARRPEFDQPVLWIGPMDGYRVAR